MASDLEVLIFIPVASHSAAKLQVRLSQLASFMRGGATGRIYCDRRKDAASFKHNLVKLNKIKLLRYYTKQLPLLYALRRLVTDGYVRFIFISQILEGIVRCKAFPLAMQPTPGTPSGPFACKWEGKASSLTFQTFLIASISPPRSHLRF